MNYEKPEITLLGDAVRLIQGTGKSSGDSQGLIPDCELDD